MSKRWSRSLSREDFLNIYTARGGVPLAEIGTLKDFTSVLSEQRAREDVLAFLPEQIPELRAKWSQFRYVLAVYDPEADKQDLGGGHLGITFSGLVIDVRNPQDVLGRVVSSESNIPDRAGVSHYSGDVTETEEIVKSLYSQYDYKESIKAIKTLRKAPESLAYAMVEHYGFRASESPVAVCYKSSRFEARGPHIAIPLSVPNSYGSISVKGFQLRKFGRGKRYTYWTPNNGGTMRMQNPVLTVYESPEMGDPTTIYITEGAFKAVTLAETYKSRAISAQGVGLLGNYDRLYRFISENYPETSSIIFAPDTDLAINPELIKSALGSLVKTAALLSENYAISFLLWNRSELYKGVDDAIVAGENVYAVTLPTWAKSLPKEARRKVYISTQTSSKTQMYTKQEYDFMKSIGMFEDCADGDIEDQESLGNLILHDTPQEAFEQLDAVPKGQTSVFQVPTGVGKTHEIAKRLEKYENLPEFWKTNYERFVYISKPHFDKNNEMLEGVATTQGRTELGRVQGEDGHWHLASDDPSSDKFRANCFFAESLDELYKMGNGAAASQMCNTKCPFRSSCIYMQQKTRLKDAEIFSTTWEAYKPLAGDLIIVDEEKSISMYKDTLLDAGVLGEMAYYLSVVRNQRLDSITNEDKSRSLATIFSVLEIVIATLKTMITSVPNKTYLTHAEIMDNVYQNIKMSHGKIPDFRRMKRVTPAITSVSRDDYDFIVGNPADYSEKALDADFLTPEDEKLISLWVQSAAEWFLAVKLLTPKLVVNRREIVVSGMYELLMSLFLDDAIILHDPKSQAFTLRITDKRYLSLITRTYSKRQRRDDASKEDSEQIYLERHTATILLDATPVNLQSVTSSNVVYHGIKSRKQKSNLKILQFPEVGKLSPHLSRDVKLRLYEKIAKVVGLISDDLGLCKEDIGVISRKSDYADADIRKLLDEMSHTTGYWLRDNVGSNEYYTDRNKVLVLLGTSSINYGALKSEAHAISSTSLIAVDDTMGMVSRSLTDDVVLLKKESNSPSVRRYIRRREVAEELQAFGRLRANRRGDEELTILVFNNLPLQEVIPHASIQMCSFEDYLSEEELSGIISKRSRNQIKRVRKTLSTQSAELVYALQHKMTDIVDEMAPNFSEEEILNRVEKEVELDRVRELAKVYLTTKYGSEISHPLLTSWKILPDTMKYVICSHVISSGYGRSVLGQKLHVSEGVLRGASRFIEKIVGGQTMSIVKTKEMVRKALNLSADEVAEILTETSSISPIRHIAINEDVCSGIFGVDIHQQDVPYSWNPNTDALYFRDPIYSLLYVTEYLHRAETLYTESRINNSAIKPMMAIDLETFYPKANQKIFEDEHDEVINKEDGPNPFVDEIRLLSFNIGFQGLETVVIDFQNISRSVQLKIIKKLMEWTVWCGQNIKFDLGFMMAKYPEIKRSEWLKIFTWDTMIADQILYPEVNPGMDTCQARARSLDVVADFWLGKNVITKDMQKSNWRMEALTQDQLRYAAMDVLLLPTIAKAQVSMYGRLRTERDPELTEYSYQILEYLFDTPRDSAKRIIDTALPYRAPWMWIESMVAPVLASSQISGMRVDKEFMLTVLAEAKKTSQQLTEEFVEYTKTNPALTKEKQDTTQNSLFSSRPSKHLWVNSPRSGKQLGEYLTALGYNLPETEKGSKMTSLDVIKDVLGTEHPVYDYLFRINEQEALIRKIEEVLKFAKDEVIHPNYKQMAAPTGRMSASRPAVMNLPVRGKAIAVRRGFLPFEGHTAIDADFSQEELRVIACIAKDMTMINSYKTGKDLHTLTAAAISNKSEANVTKEDRKNAKAVNFGFVYGMGARKFVEYAKTQYGVEFTLEEAYEIQRRFFNLYPGIRELMNTISNPNSKNSSTPYNHYYYKNGLTIVTSRAGRGMVASSLNDAMNFPVQGTGADILKLSAIFFMNRLYKELGDRADEVFILTFVHDEILVSCPEDIKDQVNTILTTTMKDAAELLVPEMPMVVEAETGSNWAEIH